MRVLVLLAGVFLLVVSINAVREQRRDPGRDAHRAQGHKRGDAVAQASRNNKQANVRREAPNKPVNAKREAPNKPAHAKREAPNKHEKAERGPHRRSEELPHEIYTDGRSKRSDEGIENGVSKRQSLDYYPYYPYYYQQSQCDICCQGKRFVGKFPATESCCGASPYDTSSALCCNNKVVSFDKNNPYYYNMQCCGEKSYNTTTQICCGDTPQDKEDFEGCCGNQKFNVMSSICCGTTIMDRPTYKSWRCCNDQVYDGTKQQCNNDGSLSDISPGYLAYQCGSQTIDFSKQICCNDMPVDRVDNYTLCCGNAGYQSNTDICCGSKTTPDDHTGTQQCCGDKIIDTTKSTCCNNAEVALPTGTDCNNYYCCGTTLYNTNKQICCGDKPTDIPTTNSYSYSCCGNNYYDSSKQTCCDYTSGVVVNGAYALCCGNQTYDSSSQTCCNSKVEAIGSIPSDTCCDDCQSTCGYYYPPYILY